MEKLAEELRSPADHAALVAEAHMENNESIRETQASRHERNKRQDAGLPTRAQLDTDEPQESSEGARESKASDPPSEMKPLRGTERGNSRTEEHREAPAEPREEQQSRKRKRDEPAAERHPGRAWQ